jgi:hypothetical protein
VWYESNDYHRRDCQAAGAIEEDASGWRVGRDRNFRRLSARGDDAYDSAEDRTGAFGRRHGLEQWKYSEHTDPDLRVLVTGR